MAHTGVLLTAFGGPDSLDAVPAFLRSIMGVEPSDAVLQGAVRKYLTIGGASPLPAMAERVAAQLERSLNRLPRADEPEEGPGLLGAGFAVPAGMRAVEGVKVPVAVGMLHSTPTIEDAIARLVESGVRELVWVSLSPFDAAVTVGAYETAVETAAAAHSGLRVFKAPAYRHSDPFVQFFAEGLSESLHDVDILKNKALVLFSAHSLPLADVASDPSYVDQLQETAAAVAAGAGLGKASGFDALDGVDAFGGPGVTSPWLLAYQSKGARGGDWLGPDLVSTVDAAAEAGFAVVVVCPVGFALDHMETLYDIDVVAADHALSAGMEFARTAVPNDSAFMIEALTESVRRAL